MKGLRLGVPKEYFAAGTDPAVADAVRAAVDKLCELGAVAEECSLPHTEYGLSAYYIIATAEASSNLARYDGVCYGRRDEVRADLLEMYLHTRKNGFGPEVKRRIMLGTYALGSATMRLYLKAQKVRTLIRRDFEQAFQKYDVLVAPTSPTRLSNRRADRGSAGHVYDGCLHSAGQPGRSTGDFHSCGFKDGCPSGCS